MAEAPGSVGRESIYRAAADAARATRGDLERLIRIPSVSLPGFDAAVMRSSAVATADALSAAGAGVVDILEAEGAHPAVFARCARLPDAPNVLLYAHHDVQPARDDTAWQSPPFAPVERDGRLYGRGTADAKAAVAVHAAVIRAFRGAPPVNLAVLIEGEEECMSPNLERFLAHVEEWWTPDVIVILDGGNPQVAEPGLTVKLRGLVDFEVEVRTLERPLHSGEAGGLVIDAVSALAHAIASLHDDHGLMRVDGLVSPGTFGRPQSVEDITAISVLAIDTPRIAQAANELIPVVRAKLSMRLGPGDMPDQAFAKLLDHLERRVPWGAALGVTPGSLVPPFAVSPVDGTALAAAAAALHDAWGVPPSMVGDSTSIAAAGMFRRSFPQAGIVITGVADPRSQAHSVDESVDLGVYERACVAETLLLSRLGQGP